MSARYRVPRCEEPQWALAESFPATTTRGCLLRQPLFHIAIQISLIGPSVSTSNMIFAPNLKA